MAQRLRLLLMSMAWLVGNLWVARKAQVVAHTAWGHRAAGRRWLDARFRLDRMRDLLIEAIKARYRVHAELPYPFPFPPRRSTYTDRRQARDIVRTQRLEEGPAARSHR